MKEAQHTMKDLHEMASRSREAFSVLSAAGAAERNRALLALANLLNLKKEEIFALFEKTGP